MKRNIKKISELTGFSAATVSNVFSGKRSVNKETARLILQTAKEHGLYKETEIQKIKFINFKNSGIVCADTPFFAAVIEGVMEECRQAGYEITVFSLYKKLEDYELRLSQILNDPNYGLLILATEMEMEDIARFSSFPGPVVLLDCSFNGTGFDTVAHSNLESAYQATEYLITQGHQKIGYLKSNISIENFRRRNQGFKKALADHGLHFDNNLVFPLTPTMEDACSDMFDLLSKGVLLPDAFFADNDNIALGAMRALQQFGYHIPKDISIIGFDDIPFSSIMTPALTTIRVYKQEMGQTAVKRLSELIEKTPSSKVKMKIQVCNEIVTRESVKKKTLLEPFV